MGEYLRGPSLNGLDIKRSEIEGAKSSIEFRLRDSRTVLSNVRKDIKEREDVLFSRLDTLCTQDAVRKSKIILPNVDTSSVNAGNGVCLLNSIIYVPHEGVGSLLPNQRIRKYIKAGKESKDEKSRGSYSFEAAFGDGSNDFVIKASKRSHPDWDNTLHECIVGMFGLNKLRGDIPNFAYIYGAFMCSPPVIDEHGKVLSWCGYSEEKVPYVVYENVSSTTLSDALASMDSLTFLNILLQITFALRRAHAEIKYTHYNLRARAVFIKNMITSASIKYITDRGEEYLRTDKLAMITDYSTSHMVYDGREYGNPNLIKYGIMARKSYPMADIYRLIYTCQTDKNVEGNPSLKGLISRIAKFFVASGKLESPTLPSIPRVRSVSFDDFSNFVRKINNSMGFLSTSFTVLYTSDSGELRVKDGPITDLISYYDVVSYDSSLKDQLNFDYPGALRAQKEKLQVLTQSIENMKIEMDKYRISLEDIPKEKLKARLAEETTVQKIRNMYILIAGMSDVIENMKVMYTITDKVVEEQNAETKTRDKRTLAELLQRFQTASSESLLELNMLMDKNRRILNIFVASASFPELLKKKPYLRWYAKDRVLMDKTLLKKREVTMPIVTVTAPVSSTTTTSRRRVETTTIIEPDSDEDGDEPY